VHDETGIHGQRAAAGFHRDGVRVAAEAGLAFEKKHIMLAAQIISRGKSGDS